MSGSPLFFADLGSRPRSARVNYLCTEKIPRLSAEIFPLSDAIIENIAAFVKKLFIVRTFLIMFLTIEALAKLLTDHHCHSERSEESRILRFFGRFTPSE
jgi:hypothetical protein